MAAFPLKMAAFPLEKISSLLSDVSQTTPGMFDDLDLRAEYLLDPFDKTSFLVGTIGPDQLESGKETFERREQEFATRVILDTGLVDKSMQDQPIRVDEQMPLAPIDFLAAVIAVMEDD